MYVLYIRIFCSIGYTLFSTPPSLWLAWPMPSVQRYKSLISHLIYHINAVSSSAH